MIYNTYNIIIWGAVRMTIKKEEIKRIFHQKKIFRLSDVMKGLSCSVATARRRLKDWHVYSSYNKNASYYTLPDVPQFNEHQLWHHRGIYFSKQGTLNKTLEVMIENSKAGLNVIEVNNLLGISAHNILSQQTIRHSKFFREKHRGIYIYYSKNPVVCSKQKEARKEKASHFNELDLPSDAESVIILVELIKHPDDTLIQLSRRVKYKRLSASTIQIQNLLCYHNLLKKSMD